MSFQASGGWELDPSSCPCDVHFIEYFRSRKFENKVVFHFGSGVHHVVGATLCGKEQTNEVLSITASKEEFIAYVDRVLEAPEFGRSYKLLFGDIYSLTPRTLPDLDLITLFHLGESPGPGIGSEGFLRETRLVETFLSKLNPDGQILFYRDSTGKETTRAVIHVLEKLRKLRRIGEYKSLLIYAGAS